MAVLGTSYQSSTELTPPHSFGTESKLPWEPRAGCLVPHLGFLQRQCRPDTAKPFSPWQFHFLAQDHTDISIIHYPFSTCVMMAELTSWRCSVSHSHTPLRGEHYSHTGSSVTGSEGRIWFILRNRIYLHSKMHTFIRNFTALLKKEGVDSSVRKYDNHRRWRAWFSCRLLYENTQRSSEEQLDLSTSSPKHTPFNCQLPSL